LVLFFPLLSVGVATHISFRRPCLPPALKNGNKQGPTSEGTIELGFSSRLSFSRRDLRCFFVSTYSGIVERFSHFASELPLRSLFPSELLFSVNVLISTMPVPVSFAPTDFPLHTTVMVFPLPLIFSTLFRLRSSGQPEELLAAVFFFFFFFCWRDNKQESFLRVRNADRGACPPLPLFPPPQSSQTICVSVQIAFLSLSGKMESFFS